MDPFRHDPEAPPDDRRFGSGWLSGVLALALAILGLGAVLCLRYPQLLTVADAREMYNVGLIRLALHLVLIAGFLLGILSSVLRKQKFLGLAALVLILLATLLGGSKAQTRFDIESDVYLGLDWFLLNLLFTGVVFIPVERLLGNRVQPVFRNEWREDLLYFFVSSLLVQALTYLSLAPSLTLLERTEWGGLREWVARQPVVLQFFEIMILTDLVQYWVHRAFHRVTFLWKFHAVHHSVEAMDWLAGSRMHLFEIVFLRGTTVIPMYVLGFAGPPLYAYLFFVYLFSTFIHSNMRLGFGPLGVWFVTPRFHHWHHGIEKEAIDVNFAIHFPFLDRLFGTFYLPKDGKWPAGYGIVNHPIPNGFLSQLVYPFLPRKATPHGPAPGNAASEAGVEKR